MVSVDVFPISTANDIPGYKIVETKGFVYGLTVRSRGAGGQIGAGVKSLFGGEIRQYVKMMEESRDEALERLKKPSISEEEAKVMFKQVADFMQISEEELTGYFNMPYGKYEDYKHGRTWLINLGIKLMFVIGKEKRVRK